MEIEINGSKVNITVPGNVSDLTTCIPFDISKNLLTIIIGYYLITYLSYLFEYLYRKQYLNINLNFDLVKYYNEFTQLVIILLYFALKPSDIWTLGMIAVLVFSSLIIRKKVLKKQSSELNSVQVLKDHKNKVHLN